MRRHSQVFRTAAVIGWMGGYLFFGPIAAMAAGSPSGGEVPSLPLGVFDRAALQKELSQPLEALEIEPTEALRARVQRLGDLDFSLDLAVDVSPVERRALNEQILTRVGQIGLLIRQRMTEPRPSARNRALPSPAYARPGGDLSGVFLDNWGLLFRLLGGLLIAFALGYLVRERRPAKATPAVARKIEAPAAVPISLKKPNEVRPMTLEQIRNAVGSGYTVLLQMGYEVRPDHRRRFLALAWQAQEILSRIEGQIYTVWEDPGHPNRFYELLVCGRLEVVNHLASSYGPLPKLAEEIDACRVPSGFSIHRAWLGALPDSLEAPHIAAESVDSLVR